MKSNTKKWIIGLIVSILATGILSPYVTSYFASVLSSRPSIQIIKGEEISAITPMWGTNWVMIKVLIKNTGSSAEQNVQVRLEVQSPWNFNGSTWVGYTFSSIPGNTAQQFVTNCQNPTVSQLEHGEFHVNVHVYGDTKSWDDATLSQSW
jgi:hypothetical protein